MLSLRGAEGVCSGGGVGFPVIEGLDDRLELCSRPELEGEEFVEVEDN